MHCIGEIRRLLDHGRENVVALDGVEAERLWGAMLDGAVDAFEVGAVLAALAVRGETPEELMGLHRAIRTRLARTSADVPERLISIPVYGIVPGEALLAALTAMLLRRFQVPVVLHGVLESPSGVSAACVLRELGILPAASLGAAAESLGELGVAFIAAPSLSPAFATLIALRSRLGIEHSAHLAAQAIDPFGSGAIRLGFAASGRRSERFESFASRLDGDFVLLHWPRGRLPISLCFRPRIERLRDGEAERLFEAEMDETRSASLPPPNDAGGIAAWIGRICSGQSPVPPPAVNLLAACLHSAGLATDFNQAKALAAVQAGLLAA